MRILIDIPEERYNEIVSGIFNADGYFKTNLTLAFRNGTVLDPCDVISREAVLKLIYDYKEKHTENREQHPINYGTLLDMIRWILELPSITATAKQINDPVELAAACDDAISREDVINIVNAYDVPQVVRTKIKCLPQVIPSINTDTIHAVGYREGLG